jgi:hypothetical protein
VCLCSELLRASVLKPARKSVPGTLIRADVCVFSSGEPKDALPVDIDEAVHSEIITLIRLAKQYDHYPLLRMLRNLTERQFPHSNPMLFEVRNYIESIEASIEQPSEHQSKLPATPHQHEQVR